MLSNFESAASFLHAGSEPNHNKPQTPNVSALAVDWIDTPLGTMICVGDNSHIYLLEFTDRVKMERQFDKLVKYHKRAIIPGSAHAIDSAAQQLTGYFSGKLRDFTVPLQTSGTQFQTLTWEQLEVIPYGETRSYLELAKMVGNPKGFRAVANSNANNGLAIIIPCHRVIAANGGLGGYAGNLSRKQWLLEHEAKHAL